MTRPRFACLTPAHDEAARIAAVLAAVVGHPLIDQVLVIDDGSRDCTAGVAQAAGARPAFARPAGADAVRLPPIVFASQPQFAAPWLGRPRFT
ncbi:hypothetical protein ACEYYB_11970 [Paracoccus sp. p4-l81]|uniref:hypothetical protein n=1 Tax=Paracoccus sp. p4-l81 TaxID=3342806 RepID=UPI0035BB963B